MVLKPVREIVAAPTDVITPHQTSTDVDVSLVAAARDHEETPPPETADG
jgi:hypothetical protein